MTPESIQIVLLAVIALVSGIATPIAVAYANRLVVKKLDVIHTLVNSTMTAAMQSEYDSMTRELASLKELMAIKTGQGYEPTKEANDAVAITESKLAILRVTLDERQRLQKQIDLELTKAQ